MSPIDMNFGGWNPSQSESAMVHLEHKDDRVVVRKRELDGDYQVLITEGLNKGDDLPDHRVQVTVTYKVSESILGGKYEAAVTDVTAGDQDTKSHRDSCKSRDEASDPLRENKSDAMSELNSSHN